MSHKWWQQVLFLKGAHACSLLSCPWKLVVFLSISTKQCYCLWLPPCKPFFKWGDCIIVANTRGREGWAVKQTSRRAALRNSISTVAERSVHLVHFPVSGVYSFSDTQAVYSYICITGCKYRYATMFGFIFLHVMYVQQVAVCFVQVCGFTCAYL